MAIQATQEQQRLDQRLDCSPLLLLLRRRIIQVIWVLTVLPYLLPQIAVGGEFARNPLPIVVGAIFSESGLAAPHNRPMLEMTRLAINQVNDNGGVLGRPLELIVFDNKSSPIGSALAARRIVLRDLTAVIGAHWSSHSLAIAPILQEAGIPMISPGSTNPEVTRGKDYIFRACFLDSFQGVAMARFARDDLQAKSAVVVTNIDENYSITLGQFFSSAFQQTGGRILSEISYRGDATDFSENIKELIRLKPDVVYLPGYTRDSGLCIKQAARMGLSTTFLGGDAWDEIEKYAGPAIAGSYQSAPWHPQVPFGASQKMQQLYYAAHGKEISNNSSPLAYDAVMILAEAITRASSFDRKAIRDALSTTSDFPGATGRITFDDNGDPLRKGIIIIQFRGGKQIFEKTIIP
jgi:branched-chain amino acid transport system substrate-binding protein